MGQASMRKWWRRASRMGATQPAGARNARTISRRWRRMFGANLAPPFWWPIEDAMPPGVAAQIGRLKTEYETVVIANEEMVHG